MTKKPEPKGLLGAFWECSACGLRYVEAPWQNAAGARCPRCGQEAFLVASVSASPPEGNPTPSPTPSTEIAVLLDNVRSAYNVGAAFRTADGAGISHLYLGGITPTPPHRGIAKTALGAEQHVAWSSHPNSVRLVEQLRAGGWAVWALETAARATPLAHLLGRQRRGVAVLPPPLAHDFWPILRRRSHAAQPRPLHTRLGTPLLFIPAPSIFST